MNTLFGTRGSPYVRILSAALAAMGADYETNELKPWDNPDYAYSLSPLGKIPVLVCDNGDTLIDTIHIVGRLSERYGMKETFLPNCQDDEIMLIVASGALESLVLMSWEFKRDEDKIDESTVRRYTRRVENSLDYINRHMAKGKSYSRLTEFFIYFLSEFLAEKNFVTLNGEYEGISLACRKIGERNEFLGDEKYLKGL
ncbi:glutathione S-transferase family protein [Serratia fonticola]|uniref:glutathione S-transferase family protein n=1 Tax=Serratia fonticola TaxID=47917 RepID=UPI00398830BE